MHTTKPAKFHVLFLAKIVFAFILLTHFDNLFSQVTGCKDPMANNYNPAATINDGSCTYNPTPYTPPVKVEPINAILNESSGLQMAGNFLWSFNDGGGAAAIYRIDTTSSTLLQTVTVGGATNVDWEDIAFDGSNFYVGDFGNNANGARDSFKIYKFPLSIIPDYNVSSSFTIPSNQVEVINFAYSDRGVIVPGPADSTRFDCEAMLIDNGQIHLFTKNWIDSNTVHYVINGLSAGSYGATPVDTLATNYLVTAADKAPGQNIIVLLGYSTTGFGKHYMHLLSDYSGGKYFNGNKRRIDLPDAAGFTPSSTLYMGLAEGIAFRNDTYGYISNEKLSFVNQKLRSFDIANFISLSVLPLTLTNFTVKSIDGTNKISWAFDDMVQNLKVEYSSNGIDFSMLKFYNKSLKDIVYNTALSPVNYYRISWQKDNGAIQYSNIISIKNDMQRAVAGLSLNANGRLRFVVNGNSTAIYSFKVLSSDGRLLGVVKERSYPPGVNTIYISKASVQNNFVYLLVYHNDAVKTSFLQVEK